METLALLGGKRCVTARPASPTWPRYSPRGVATVALMLATGRGLAQGQVVDDAAVRFAAYHGMQYALATDSGTGALLSALAGCGIAPGDEVITTPYSYGGTTGCLLHYGAVPVFADVLPVTGLLDPALVPARITPRTRAILVVHLYGQPAEMHALQAIAREYKLALIEDASQAHGARYHGQLVGTLGDAAGFSCMSTKLLAAGELGMLLTNDRDVYDRAALLGQHTGVLRRPPTARGGGLSAAYLPYVDSLGYNCRATGIDCALLLDQLPRLDGWNRTRAANRDRLTAALRDLELLDIPVYPPEIEPGYLMLTMTFHPERAGVSRETFVRALAAEGVRAFVYLDCPIPQLPRLHGPAPAAPWQAARTRATAPELPVCTALCRNAFQLSFGALTEPEPRLLRQYADAFHKVVAHLPALRALEGQRVLV